ncbi:hypothetical protein [Rhizobium sp.]
MARILPSPMRDAIARHGARAAADFKDTDGRPERQGIDDGAEASR